MESIEGSEDFHSDYQNARSGFQMPVYFVYFIVRSFRQFICSAVGEKALRDDSGSFG